MTILIADDSPRMRHTIQRTIMQGVQGIHKVFEAAEGGEAIRMYESVHPDWVLLDIRMEPVDGLTASLFILEAHPEARIVILTNYDDAAYRKTAHDAGVIAYVLKDHLDELPSILELHAG